MFLGRKEANDGGQDGERHEREHQLPVRAGSLSASLPDGLLIGRRPERAFGASAGRSVGAGPPRHHEAGGVSTLPEGRLLPRYRASLIQDLSGENDAAC